ncbi:hypothetical protein EVAR_96535_1 [Eumeta japonica]|uniref:SAM domain-containing protein n=1 Tax=Eumeta variegata TaxID=151549 RepID=A0A4C1WCW3_EUMVA|nr:hypothetical protein EVAR_96535_1 [Eumeta japonica]
MVKCSCLRLLQIIIPTEKAWTEGKVKQEPTDESQKPVIKSEKTSFLFDGFAPEAIKTWKVQQFMAYFEELGHERTAKIFQEQELDGKALALASQRDLEAVGVEEKLAKDLCEFMSPARASCDESILDNILL